MIFQLYQPPYFYLLGLTVQRTLPLFPRMYPKEGYDRILYSDTRFPSIIKGSGHAYTWRDITFKIFFFASFELAFIALAWTAYKKQGIQLHIFVENSATGNLAHSVFSWVVIIWNALAINSLKDIVLYVFSTEWLSQSHNTDYSFVAGRADRVSVLTSGLVDQIIYFFSGTATRRYKVALVMFLLLLSSKGFVPGTVSLDTAVINVTLPLSVADVTFGQSNIMKAGTNESEGTIMGIGRATSFMMLEQIERITCGYNSENVLIPWPNLTYHLAAGAGGSQFCYTSDVMSYDFNCNWTTPTAPPQPSQSHPGSWLWEVDIQGQRVHLTSFKGLDTSAFAPMVPIGSYWDVHPITIFIFRQLARDNATDDANIVLHDQNLPKRFDPPMSYTAMSYHEGDITTSRIEAASVLICDPRPRTYTANVTVHVPVADSLTASSPYLVATETLPHPTVGNLDQSFIPILFDIGIFGAPLIIPDSILGTSPLLTTLTRLMFFCNLGDACQGDLNPLPLKQIAQNMNRFFGSGVKAFLDGYNGPPTGSQALEMPDFKSFKTNVTIQENIGLRIVASRPFVFASTAAFVCVVFLLVVLIFLINPKHLKSFNLDTVDEIFGLNARLGVEHVAENRTGHLSTFSH